MVKLVCGKKGTGKTKRLIKMANEDAKGTLGDIVFVDSDVRHMLDLNHKIRYVNAMEFEVKGIEMFHGFLCGLIAEDYDIEKIYIDAVYKIADIDLSLLHKYIQRLENLSNKFKVDIILSLNIEGKDIPENIKKYVI
ncbi:hypothetical protein SAMN02745135_01554 [Caloranaerobacter azorensis DSM 13643]|uniref:Twitching motility protein PilT n=1 Tax=Caloranaerobacter azorensis DSM 13643 TaxID=1121264 RepID=A0A1M5URX8_9FIRM|nr:hypothetical protein [Caloranaerobacter azorensis]SHH65731.1 hypothetical protein SAMN02745135_01554 [Caloranaerobacter azorensis DSM 13643]